MPASRSFAIACVVLAAAAGCTSNADRGKTSSSPTAPSAVAAGADGAALTAAIDRSIAGSSFDGSRVVSQAVQFPSRDGTFQFRQQLETAYRDQLRRGATSSFVDIEGSIVWTQEYLRYRVNGCGHQDAVSRVTAQIQGRGIQPICQDFSGATVTFPPRNEPFAFRQDLERVYRDELRRDAVQTFVDAEGDIVWTQEYLRYRLNGCSHADATDRVLAQVSGGAVQPTCSSTTAPPGGGSITAFVTGVSTPGGTTTLVNSPRPNAGAGPIVTVSNNSGGLITLAASSPIDRIIVSVNTTAVAPTRIGPLVVLGSYYEVRLASPQTSVQLTLAIQNAGAFTLEFAASLGSGPLGPYQPQRSGRIELTVSPASVSYAGGSGLGLGACPAPYLSRWGPFTWNLRETNGVAVEITSFKYVVTTSAGSEVSNEEIVRSISGAFTGSGAPTLRVPAGASLTSRPQYDCELETNGAPAFPGGTAVFIASGRDENGALVSSTARLTLLPPR